MEDFDKLVEIFERLRAPGGCPWDAEQDHRSISRCVIEEAYELYDAILHDDKEHMREELGDVLLQVIFHSIIARDHDEFELKDVINGLAEKLIARHPHVFGELSVGSPEDVKRNWEMLKKNEKGKNMRESILDGVPESLPSILAARKIQSAASRVGFDWSEPEAVIKKICEELDELAMAIQSQNVSSVEDEVGDLLFSAVNLARKCNVDPEAALRKTNRKFRKRFMAIEMEARKRGIDLDKMTLHEMDQVWERAKGLESTVKKT